MLENNFSSGLRVTVLNDFLKPEETCTKPSINYSKPQKMPEEITPNGMLIEYDNTDKTEDNSMAVEPTQIAKISLADCLACSGCITSSEVIFLESQSTSEFSKQISQNKKTIVVSINQQAVSSLAVHYQITPEQTFSKLRTFFKGIGVNYVFALSSMRDISLIEVAKEFVERKRKSMTEKTNMPMLLGYCPGWVCYAEKAGDASVLDHISTAKSSQQLMGNYLKNTFCQQLNIDPSEIYHACVSQCYDKKLEAVRDSITNPEEVISEVDIVLSTTEVVDLINQHTVNFADLPETSDSGYHSEFTRISDAQFGPSHGFLDLSLKFAAKEFYGIDLDLTKIVYTKGRNNEMWETELSVNGQVVLTMARAYGFRNIQNIMRAVKRKTCKYDFVELLACPGGCTNGGGQIKAIANENPKELLTKVNDAYNSTTTPIQDPLSNPFVSDYYTKIIPEVETQQKQLHTSYKVLQPASSSHLASSKITW